MREPLPIDARLDEIVHTVRSRGAAVVVAPPGAGKTTRIPPALVEDGPAVLLQPRRIAARSLARRIAAERGWTLGDEVGWQVRFERRFRERTRLLVVTEGVLTARLQSDPLLEGFRTVVLDEFHERTVHADLALALAWQAARARGDLRVVVMSATLDAAPVADFLGGCPVLELPGRGHPVEIAHAPALALEDASRRALADGDAGHVLCFLPGAPEIRRAGEAVAAEARRAGVDVLPLHGSLSPREQDAALRPSDRRKLILATNIAETSLTVDGVSQVIDTGLHKVVRHDLHLGIDRLRLERIPADSAEQRAGRAGRTGPGRALRLWDRRERRRAHREPEILRVDLAGPCLDVLDWGGDPRSFAWFEPPPIEGLDAALRLLERLGAVRGTSITPLGRALRRLPVSPRLGRLLLAAGASRVAAAACAILAEGWRPAVREQTSRSDLLVLADRIHEAPEAVRRAAEQLQRTARLVARDADPGGGDDSLLRAVLAAYPDRVARRRESDRSRVLLSSGHGAVLARESTVRGDPFLVAVEVVGARHGGTGEARVRLASAVDPGWLEPTGVEVVHELAPDATGVRAVERRLYDRLVLEERSVPPDDDRAASLLATRLLDPAAGYRDEALERRLAFAGLTVDWEPLVRERCRGLRTLPRPDWSELLPHDLRRRLRRLAPSTLPLPSGRQAQLEYREDGTVVAAVKLQELFGLAQTPCLGPSATPVTFALLAPNGRPVQTTRDLRSFWNHAYREVRRELRGRYPKHPWPEDPWTAPPTSKTRRRR